jgi:plastocyanin
MVRLAGVLMMVLGLSRLGTRAATAQERHVVRMEVDAERNEYRFEPAKVTARPGDILIFRTVSGAPHSIVFEGGGLETRARTALNDAMPRRAGELSSPLLTRNGAEYRVTVPQLPAGSYSFYCLPHRAYDMRGELEIR